MFEDVNDFLLGSSAPIAKLDVVGKVIRGTVIKAEVAQSRDFKTKALKFYSDGQPIKMVIVTLQTEDRREDVPDDDGVRRFFFDGANLMRALREGIKRSKLVAGGTIAVKYTGNGTPPGPGLSAPKEYAVKYEPPADDFSDVDPF